MLILFRMTSHVFLCTVYLKTSEETVVLFLHFFFLNLLSIFINYTCDIIEQATLGFFFHGDFYFKIPAYFKIPDQNILFIYFNINLFTLIGG